MAREKGKWKVTVTVGSAVFKTFHVITGTSRTFTVIIICKLWGVTYILLIILFYNNYFFIILIIFLTLKYYFILKK